MKKKLPTAKIIIMALGIISLLYGAAVFMSIGTGHWFNYAFMVLGIALITLGSFLPKIADWIRSGEKDGKSVNARKVSVLVILGLLCLCLINFGIFEAKVLKFAHSEPDKDPCWIIVLGAKVKPGNVPSLEYAVRLQTAAEFFNSRAAEDQGSSKSEDQASDASEKNDIRLILTGGKGADEPASEASVGYSYIKNLLRTETANAAIPEDRIYLEEKSTSTTENLKFAREIIEANGGSVNDSVVIISSSFHLYRASVLAREQGYTSTSFLGSTGLKILIPYYYVREYAAYVRERLPF